MAYLRKIKGNWYTIESYREDGKVKQRILRRHGKTKPPKYQAGDEVGQKVSTIEGELKQKQLDFPNRQFETILLDPPWHYHSRTNDPSHRNRISYPSMSIGEISRLPIPTLAKDDSYIFMWVTKDYLPDAFWLFQNWGVTFKQIITWVKVTKDYSKIRFTTGHWLRNACEFCLLGIKGKPKALGSKGITDVPNAFHHPMLDHSEKPEFIHEIIEDFVPEGERLELFARKTRQGWEQWGGELD